VSRRSIPPDPEAARRPPPADQEASGPGSLPDVLRLDDLAEGEGIVTMPPALVRRIARALPPPPEDGP
jgi:hypothetical protein